MSDAPLAALLQLARKPPHPDRWRVLCALCEPLSQDAFNDIAPELEGALAGWPVELRLAPPAWREHLEAGQPPPAVFALVRGLRLQKLKATALKRVFKSKAIANIEHLVLVGCALGGVAPDLVFGQASAGVCDPASSGDEFLHPAVPPLVLLLQPLHERQ